MSDIKKELKDRITFNNEPLIDVATRCADVAYRLGSGGRYTEKSINENAFELVQSFMDALGFETEIKIEFVEDDQN